MTIENELTQARINLLEMQTKAIKDSLPSSVDEIIKVDIGSLETGLQEIMTDIMGKMTSPHTDTKCKNDVVKKQIRISFNNGKVIVTEGCNSIDLSSIITEYNVISDHNGLRATLQCFFEGCVDIGDRK